MSQQNRPIEILNKWPNFLEVYEGPDGKRTYLFVVVRNNSRALQSDQRQMLEHLQDAGLNVAVRVGAITLTLEQFDTQGVYSVATPMFSSRQQLYNERHTLKGLQDELTRTSPDSPRYEQIARRIKMKRELIQSANNYSSPDADRESDERLKRIEAMINAATIEDPVQRYLSMPHDLLAKQDMAAINKLGNKVLSKTLLLARSEQRLAEKQAELTLEPDNLDIRAQIIDEEKRIERLQGELNNLTAAPTAQEGTPQQ